MTTRPRSARSSRRCRPPWPDRLLTEHGFDHGKGPPAQGGLFCTGAGMSDDLEALKTETAAALAAATDLRAWDAVRVGVLGKNGSLTGLLKELGKASPDERRARGAALNALKDKLMAAVEARRVELEAEALDARLAAERLDVTLPPRPITAGLIHPISRTMEE